MLAAGGFLLGSAEVIFSNAAQSVLPALVPPELLPKANGSQQVSLTVGESFLGPPVGSLLFAAAAALPFGLDAASFAGSAALLARLPRTRHAPGRRQARPEIRAQIAEGLRWLAGHRLLRVVAVLLGVYNFANQMGQAVLVLLATQTLHVSTRGYGLLLAATAVGSVVGGLVNPVLTRRLGNAALAGPPGARSTPPPSSASGSRPARSWWRRCWPARGSRSPCGTWSRSACASGSSPVDLLGRVNSVYRMLGWGLMPVGALTGGFVAHAAGLRAPYVIAGSCAACPPWPPSRSCWPPAATRPDRPRR